MLVPSGTTETIGRGSPLLAAMRPRNTPGHGTRVAGAGTAPICEEPSLGPSATVMVHSGLAPPRTRESTQKLVRMGADTARVLMDIARLPRGCPEVRPATRVLQYSTGNPTKRVRANCGSCGTSCDPSPLNFILKNRTVFAPMPFRAEVDLKPCRTTSQPRDHRLTTAFIRLAQVDTTDRRLPRGKPPMRTLPGVAIILMASFANPTSERTHGPIATAFFDGDRLLARCERNEPACYAYVAGVADLLATATAYGTALVGLSVCIPSDVTIQQTAEIAINFLKSHAEERRDGAAGLVAVSLQEAFPCTSL